MDFYTWCDRACSRIRFKRDREEVYRELLDHLNDKREHLTALGYSSADATEAAMTEMGDAEALARQLERVHRPWVGWLWVASRWLVGIMIAVMIVALLGGRFRDLADRYWFTAYEWGQLEDGTQVKQRSSQWRYNPENAREGDHISFPVPPAKSVKGGQYTFSIVEAALWRHDARVMRGNYIEESASLYFRLRAKAPVPWAGIPYAYTMLSAEDDLGNLYPPADLRSEGETASVWGNVSDRRPLSYDFEMCVSGLDPAARWVDIQYDYLGTAFSLRISLEEAS